MTTGLALVARLHVDLRRVASAVCLPAETGR
ncbi:MAG: putative leader peptide [Actinomycetes bacterium]